MWRKERWLRLSPQQVMCMLWKNNLLISRVTVQRLIQDIMWCSRDLDLIKEKTKEIEQRIKNMIDVLGRI
ncbi:hypothetical protein AB205_0115930 [Aquarana catesbeiana]|uniref:Uncharacterized protein n=1 Tax=Aquarana catesbeiana TaxID=8400 RepID=A0A2G9R455_AQUCT|nr:hypothetical protein AB205_0115930 [Aquarana catesbeiana]